MKTKQSRGQEANTRSKEQADTAHAKLDDHISRYMAARQAMISLGSLSVDDPESPFPPLSVEDTYRKPTDIKRRLGDSRRTDGTAWMARPAAANAVAYPKDFAVGMTEPAVEERKCYDVSLGTLY